MPTFLPTSSGKSWQAVHRDRAASDWRRIERARCCQSVEGPTGSEDETESDGSMVGEDQISGVGKQDSSRPSIDGCGYCGR